MELAHGARARARRSHGSSKRLQLVIESIGFTDAIRGILEVGGALALVERHELAALLDSGEPRLRRVERLRALDDDGL